MSYDENMNWEGPGDEPMDSDRYDYPDDDEYDGFDYEDVEITQTEEKCCSECRPEWEDCHIRIYFCDEFENEDDDFEGKHLGCNYFKEKNQCK